MTTQTLPIAIGQGPEQGLTAYFNHVNAVPMLSAEQEHDLAVRYYEHNDLDAARQLVLAHLRYVVRVARGFNGYGLALADLIQEGNIGLMKAVKHFDPYRGVRLVSFAVHWIRAEIYDFVLQNWRIVKVATTKAQRRLFFNLRKSRKQLGWMSRQEVDDLANDLNVDPDVVLEMEARMSGGDTSFDPLVDADRDDGGFAPAGYLEDMRYNPEALVSASDAEANRTEQLDEALQALDDRSRDIVQRRWLSEDKPTLHELASEYGVSAERIRQIEKKALGHMKHVLSA
jgi:RNA polymerase sigma-32 factor